MSEALTSTSAGTTRDQPGAETIEKVNGPRDASVREPVRDPVVQDLPAREASAHEAAPRDISPRDVPLRETAAREAPARETPARETPLRDAPARENVRSESPARASTRRERSRWRTLLDHLGTILLSLALALVIWLIAVSQANPLITEQFPDRLPITVRGLDSSLQSVQDLGNEGVRVRIRAPAAAWDDLDVADFSVSVNLSGVGEGSHEIPVEAVVNDTRVDILEINPPNLLVKLDPVATSVLTVTATVLDSPAFGYDWTAPIVEPPTVTVRGPASQVDLVTQVVAPIYLLNAKSQVERTVATQPLNRQNQEVTGVEMSVNFVHVVVPVEQWPGRKEVAVRINLVGQPATGYRLSSVRAEPSTIVLQGRAELLASVPGYIETEPLSIDGATSDIRTRLSLVVPAGVSVFDGDSVQAVVNITAIEGGTTATMRPVPQGLGPGLSATVSPETVDVILSGPIPSLEGLNPDDVFAILDLSGLLPGTHVVRPRTVMPEGITEGGVLPETVEVVISAVATSEPEPPPAPTEEPASSLVPEVGPAATGEPVQDGAPASTATGAATPSPATPSPATPSSATPSPATPSSATPQATSDADEGSIPARAVAAGAGQGAGDITAAGQPLSFAAAGGTIPLLPLPTITPTATDASN